MNNILSLTQKYNQLFTSIEKIQTKITSPTTTTLTVLSGGNVIINFKSLGYLTMSLAMTSDIHSFTFQNPAINGNYKIFLQSTSPFRLNKNLGANIKNNLNGNTVINGDFTIDIFYNGNSYFLNFTNYT